MADLLRELNTGLAAVAEAARASLVQISNGRRGHGAGTVWSADGLIVTNAHVARQEVVQVTLPDGRTLRARLIARHPSHDLAVLKADASDLQPIQPGDSRALRPGQWVLALGHPWGVTAAATAGVVIGVGEGIPENPAPGLEWVAASLHYRPGHSGGPLVDAQGRMVGIGTVMAGPDVGLAVPTHIVAAFIDALRGKGHHRAAA